jgi:hypothetical protein
VLWAPVLTVKVPQHATSYAGMELIAYGGTDTHHGRKILWRKIQREGRRASHTVTVSHAPTRRAFPSVRFDHLAYFHNGSRRRENRPDMYVLLFGSISYETRYRLFLFLSHPPAPRRADGFGHRKTQSFSLVVSIKWLPAHYEWVARPASTIWLYLVIHS